MHISSCIQSGRHEGLFYQNLFLLLLYSIPKDTNSLNQPIANEDFSKQNRSHLCAHARVCVWMNFP